MSTPPLLPPSPSITFQLPIQNKQAKGPKPPQQCGVSPVPSILNRQIPQTGPIIHRINRPSPRNMQRTVPPREESSICSTGNIDTRTSNPTEVPVSVPALVNPPFIYVTPPPSPRYFPNPPQPIHGLNSDDARMFPMVLPPAISQTQHSVSSPKSIFDLNLDE